MSRKTSLLGPRLLAAATTSLFCSILIVGTAMAQEFSLPVRWCVIGDDANGNGMADAGELGAPTFTDPSLVGETSVDMVLWRRHERPSDRTYIPQADVTFRSALWNIAEDSTLNFPIIPDPDTSDSDHEYGDLLIEDPFTELFDARDDCIQAWTDDHGVDDIGLVAVVARRLVDAAGNPTANGAAVPSALWLHDNAFVFPNPTPEGDLRDPFDGTAGHEFGHALPASLDHTSSDTNIMRTSPADVEPDGVRDNFDLSNSITDNDGDLVDQIDLVNSTAPSVPGCKLTGTNTDCSTRSDARVASTGDVAERFLDLRLVTLADRDSLTTAITHELVGPFDQRLSEFSEVAFFSLLDTDGNAATGGRPETLGIPTAFSGAEIVARVVVQAIGDPTGTDDVGQGATRFVGQPTLWRHDAESGRYVEIVGDKLLRAIVAPVEIIIDPLFSGGLSRTAVVAHTVEVAFSNDVRGPIAPNPRLQAISRGAVPGGGAIVDKLDQSPDEAGIGFRLVFPTFPVCNVTPRAVTAGDKLRVRGSVFPPDVEVKVILGDTLIGSAQIDADGTFVDQFSVPADARTGKRLITVGVMDTALTADCTAIVNARDVDGGNLFEKCCEAFMRHFYIIIVALVVILILLLVIVFRRR